MLARLQLSFFLELAASTNINHRGEALKSKGEVIDVSIPRPDNDITKVLNSMDLGTKYQAYTDDHTGEHAFESYSIDYLILDLVFVLFISTEQKPWTDPKFAKRIKRFFGLLLIRSFYKITDYMGLRTNERSMEGDKQDEVAELQLAYFNGMSAMDPTVVSSREGIFAVADDQERYFWSLIYDFSVEKLASNETVPKELLSIYLQCAEFNAEIIGRLRLKRYELQPLSIYRLPADR